MNDPQKYVDRLRKLYDDRKIGVGENSPPFSCCHLVSCIAAAKDRDLCLGAEAHVGEKYGDPIRLVVVSMDTGRGAEIEKGEHLLQRRANIQGVIHNEANPHMKGTIQTLRHLYGYGQKPDCDLLQRFAMINSAKCSGKDDDTSSMPWKLYKNCWDHGLAELNILNPQLIVTQGAKARDLLKPQEIDEAEIRKHIPSLKWGNADVGARSKEYLKCWKNGDRAVLVLQGPHPSARRGQWQLFERTILPTIAHVVRQMTGLEKGYNEP